MSYNIVGNISSNKLTLYSPFRQTDLNEKSCAFFRNLSLIQSPFISYKFSHNLTFFRCLNHSADPHIQDYFGNHSRVYCHAPPTVYYRNLTTHVPLVTATVPTTCSMIQLPTKSSPVSRELFDVLTAEFNLEWDVHEDCYKCNDRGGQCVSDSMNKFHCREKEWSVSKDCYECYHRGGQCDTNSKNEFYCKIGSKRALIYDFMPNGSLEKLIAGNTASSSAESGLGWDKLFEIALGIARGLEYLHQGCNTRILHLDIKPQNILLDRDLNPRISDFGLAKLCPNRSSIVSMLVARGTVGYIAPEVFSRNFGEVSYKSDVYSYGMLVLEMVGARKNIDPRDVDDTSEIYFPHYIYKQLEMDAERNCDLLGTMNEDGSQATKRNLIIVGLWCIQTNPKDRPSMTKVVEMLEGKLGALEVPPKPYLYSPPRTAPSVSTSESL